MAYHDKLTRDKLTLACVQADYGARRLRSFLAELVNTTVSGAAQFVTQCLALVARNAVHIGWCNFPAAMSRIARAQNRPLPTTWRPEHRVVEWPAAPYSYRLPGGVDCLSFSLNFAACCVLANHLDAERRRFAYMLDLHMSPHAAANVLLATLVNGDFVQYVIALQSRDVSRDTLAIHATIAKLDQPLLLAKSIPRTASLVATLASIASAPHTPDTHALHGPAFRAAVAALYLCNTRVCVRLPSEMLENITTLMSRDAWATCFL